MTIGLLAGAALGVLRGKKNEARMEENDKFRRAAIQYSPWTKMSDPGSAVMPGMLEAGTTGAATGAMVGNLFPAASTLSTGLAGVTGENMLGSSAMTGQLEGMKDMSAVQGMGAAGAQGAAQGWGGVPQATGPFAFNGAGPEQLDAMGNPTFRSYRGFGIQR